MTTILRIDASMRHEGSVTRVLADKVLDRLNAGEAGVKVILRDLADGLAHIDETWIAGNFTAAEERSDAQRTSLGLSDILVAELRAADVILLAVPVYNFGVPAAFKAWIDQVARAGETFRFTEDGPIGLLQGKRAILVTASGGTEIDGPIDFATPFIRHVMSFIGIDDISVISADRMMVDAEAALAAADSGIAHLAA